MLDCRIYNRRPGFCDRVKLAWEAASALCLMSSTSHPVDTNVIFLHPVSAFISAAKQGSARSSSGNPIYLPDMSWRKRWTRRGDWALRLDTCTTHLLALITSQRFQLYCGLRQGDANSCWTEMRSWDHGESMQYTSAWTSSSSRSACSGIMGDIY